MFATALVAVAFMAIAIVATGAVEAQPPPVCSGILNASSCSLDVWAGRAEWAPLSGDEPGFNWNELQEVEIGIEECGPPENADHPRHNSSSFYFANGSVGPNDGSPSTGLVLSTVAPSILPNGTGLRVDMLIGADWTYAGPLHGNLTWVLFYLDGTVSCGDFRIPVNVHATIEFAKPPHLWSDRFGDYVEPIQVPYGEEVGGTWVSNNTTVHLAVGPFRYKGTDHAVEAPLHVGLQISYASHFRTVPSARKTVEWSWDYSGLSHSSYANVNIRAWPDPWARDFPLWELAFLTVRVDADPPELLMAYPSPGEPFRSSKSPVAVGLRACDHNQSGIDTDGATIALWETSGSGSEAMTSGWIASSARDGCVDALLQLAASASNSSFEVVVRDRVGNTATTLVNISVRPDVGVVTFGSLLPQGWTASRNLTLSGLAAPPPGAAMDLSSVEWSISDRPADPREWRSAGLPGSSPGGTVSTAFSAPRDGPYFVAWRARAVGSEAWGYSMLYSFSLDIAPAEIAQDGICGPPLSSGLASLAFEIRDTGSGLDLDGTYLEVQKPDGSAMHLLAESSTAGVDGSRRVNFAFSLSRGLTRVQLVATDLAGNTNRSAPCEIQFVTPAFLLPAETGAPFWGILLAFAAAGLVAVLRRQRKRQPKEDGPALPKDPV